MELKKLFALAAICLLVSGVFLTAAPGHAAYSIARGQSIAINKATANPATVVVKLAQLVSKTVSNFVISIFGLNYTVSSSTTAAVGSKVNVVGYLDPVDTTLITMTPGGTPSSTATTTERTEPYDSEPAGPLGASTCFVANGLFHQPSPGNEVKHFDLPLPQSTSYQKVRIDVDVTVGPWNPTAPSGIHDIFWFVRRRNRNMFGYVNAHGPGKNDVFLRYGIGQSLFYKAKIVKKVTLQPDKTYSFAYVYEVAPTRDITLDIVDSSTGQVVGHFAGVPDVPGINVGNERFLIEFGFPVPGPNGNPLELPTYGWKYQNLRVAFVSNGVVPRNCTTLASGPPVDGDAGDDSGPPTSTPRPPGGGGGRVGGGRCDESGFCGPLDE